MNSIIKKILEGKVIAIPTDTVYGLICDAYNNEAIEKIYSIKGRDINKPLSIFVKDISSVYDIVDNDCITNDVYRLMNEYWPGALTIIFKKKIGVLEHLNIGASTIGIRIPSDQRLLSILNELDIPLAQTSCNFSGESPYHNSSDIKANMGSDIDYIVEGNIENDTIASTVIDVSAGKILVIRHGSISEKEKFES